jgi:hypothetical protein
VVDSWGIFLSNIVIYTVGGTTLPTDISLILCSIFTPCWGLGLRALLPKTTHQVSRNSSLNESNDRGEILKRVV